MSFRVARGFALGVLAAALCPALQDSHEHPDADAANGVSGTETITWSLRRS